MGLGPRKEIDYAGPRAMSEPFSLLTLVGRMKVHAFAQLVGMSVEELAAAVIQAPRHHARADTTPTVAVIRPRPPMAVAEPPLAAMLGRATYRQIRAAVDHWVFTRAFEESGTVVGVARRLRMSRLTVRRRWVRVRGLDHEDWSATRGHPIPAPPPPSLSAIFERGGKYAAIREAVERWMLGAALVHTGGNFSQAARTLEMPRTLLHKRWGRVAPSRDGGA